MPTQAEPAVLIRRVAVVMNGRAGALLDGDRPLRDAFAKAGLDPVFIAPQAGTLPQRMAQAVELGLDAVVVAGGDGTVACAARAMVGRELPLAILPFGTMNLLAKDLGLPLTDPLAGLAALARGRLRAIDVGEVNGHVFLCASMLGLPARLGRTREETRGGGLRAIARMARATGHQLLQARPLRVTMVADGAPIRLNAASLTVTMNPIDPASGRSVGRTALDGGQFGIYVVERLGPAALLGLVARLLFGRRTAAVRERVARRVEIGGRAPALQVMNDGEPVRLAPPLHYRIRPGALRVLVPDP